MGYSGIFSPEEDKYPLVCVHEAALGEPCPSCGLSHAFSLIVRGRLAEAMEWNSYSIRVFLFFALQLILRIALSFIYIREQGISARNGLIATDTVVTSVMFMVAFFPLIQFIVRSAMGLF